MEEDLTDEELKELTRRKREEIRQEEGWTKGKVERTVGGILKEEYEEGKRARDKEKQHTKRRKAREKRERRRRGKGRYTGPKSGFIKTANDFWEGLCKQSFGANQGKVFAYMVRNIWGWQKRSGFIRVTKCAKELGIPKQRVSEALSSLVKRRIVTVNRDKTLAIQIISRLGRLR